MSKNRASSPQGLLQKRRQNSLNNILNKFKALNNNSNSNNYLVINKTSTYFVKLPDLARNASNDNSFNINHGDFRLLSSKKTDQPQQKIYKIDNTKYVEKKRKNIFFFSYKHPNSYDIPRKEGFIKQLEFIMELYRLKTR
jgi:hypothetical protein